MSRLIASFLLAGLMAATPMAYLKLGFFTSTGLVGIHWTQPVSYFVTNRDADGVTAAQLQAAMGRAFSTWASVPRVAVTHSFTGFTGAEPFAADGINVIGFRARPELDRTLGAATFEFDEVTGQILESDIFFNTTFKWSVAPAGQAERFDLESVGLHEVGHLLGMGHSALGETEIRSTGGRRVLGKRAVMFPIAYPAGNIEDRTLEADDRAGFADIYGSGAQTGTISGRVTLGNAGIFGAHVTALHTGTGDLVSTFSLTAAGDFTMAGLAPGLYVVRVEPLDDADLDSFFDEDTGVNISFKPAFFAKLVPVPRGGAGPSLHIVVNAK
ncbi:MAG: matrixin family metalloprotease [Acidobacteria bacterium]|nr:matrixin family metalloprotease [Acidobacteriota bacterium]